MRGEMIVVPADESFEFSLWQQEKICSTHKPYERLKDAEKGRKSLETKSTNKFSIFICGWCGDFHVGTKRKGVSADNLVIMKHDPKKTKEYQESYIKPVALNLGFEPTNRTGIYSYKGYEIDLSASVADELSIMKNTARQLADFIK